jgi:hypothetical protein
MPDVEESKEKSNVESLEERKLRLAANRDALKKAKQKDALMEENG